MDIRKMYQDKLVSASEAAKTVKSGDWVDYAWTTSTPVAVDAEIAKRLPELYNVNFRGGILMWVPEIFKIENPADHFTWNSWHMSGIERKAIAQGFAFYGPMRYSELPRFYGICPKKTVRMWPYSRQPPWTSTASLTSAPTHPTWLLSARLPGP